LTLSVRLCLHMKILNLFLTYPTQTPLLHSWSRLDRQCFLRFICAHGVAGGLGGGSPPTEKRSNFYVPISPPRSPAEVMVSSHEATKADISRVGNVTQSPRETLTLKAGQYKYTDTTSLNILSSPDPFPLGLHALPLGLLDRACTQSGADEFTREKGSASYIHTRLIN